MPLTLAEMVFLVYESSWAFMKDIAGEIIGSSRYAIGSEGWKILYSWPTLGEDTVGGSPVIAEICSPEENPALEPAARNGSCIYSGSIGDSAGKASSLEWRAKIFLPLSIWKRP